MSQATDHERQFVEYLLTLVPRSDRDPDDHILDDRSTRVYGQGAQGDRAALAALRRGLGKSPGEATEMFPYVMRFISDEMPVWRQDNYFLIASLFASHPDNSPSSETDDRKNPLGASVHRLDSAIRHKRGIASTEKSSVEKRFVALLNAERDDLPEHLRHVVALLKAEDIPVNWAKLLHDLDDWGRADRRVQRAWALAYWQVTPGRSTQSGTQESGEAASSDPAAPVTEEAD